MQNVSCYWFVVIQWCGPLDIFPNDSWTSRDQQLPSSEKEDGINGKDFQLSLKHLSFEFHMFLCILIKRKKDTIKYHKCG